MSYGTLNGLPVVLQMLLGDDTEGTGVLLYEPNLSAQHIILLGKSEECMRVFCGIHHPRIWFCVAQAESMSSMPECATFSCYIFVVTRGVTALSQPSTLKETKGSEQIEVDCRHVLLFRKASFEKRIANAITHTHWFLTLNHSHFVGLLHSLFLTPSRS